jgi:insulysin
LEETTLSDSLFYVLRCTLRRDETSPSASASMDIAVGSFWDPKVVPGSAHFLEHMLFLGSSKYPQEGSFDELLSQVP